MARIIFTDHANQRKLERSISDNEIKEALAYPDYTISSFEERKISVKKVGSRTISVVYKSEKDNIIVITVY